MSSFIVYVWDDSRGTSNNLMVVSTESRKMVELIQEMGMLHKWRVEVKESDGGRTRYGKWPK